MNNYSRAYELEHLTPLDELAMILKHCVKHEELSHNVTVKLSLQECIDMSPTIRLLKSIIEKKCSGIALYEYHERKKIWEKDHPNSFDVTWATINNIPVTKQEWDILKRQSHQMNMREFFNNTKLMGSIHFGPQITKK